MFGALRKKPSGSALDRPPFFDCDCTAFVGTLQVDWKRSFFTATVAGFWIVSRAKRRIYRRETWTPLLPR
jgi:hypothetical protein